MALSGRVSALPKAGSIGTKLGKLGWEMLVIPAQLWMFVAELAGTVALVALRRIVWPLAVGVAGIARSAYRLAARRVTPARGVAVVALAALAALSGGADRLRPASAALRPSRAGIRRRAAAKARGGDWAAGAERAGGPGVSAPEARTLAAAEARA